MSQGTVSISTGPNGSGIVYRLSEDLTLVASDNQAFATVEASAPGEESNVGAGALTFHSFTNYSDYLNRTLKVSNLAAIANGKNFESDANFRFRIVNRVLEAEAANETAIRLAILSTPGVANVLIVPRYRGIGTFGTIIQSTTPTVSQELLDEITFRVSEVQAEGTLAFVQKPKETGLSMRLTVHYSQRLEDDVLSAIEDELEIVITDFVNDLDLGGNFSVNRLVSELFAVSDQVTNFGEAGKPIDEVYIHRESNLSDNKVRELLLGDYTPAEDERVIIEPSLQNPITFERSFTRR